MEGYIGEIKMFAGTFAPLNWAFCSGQLLGISSNSAIYSVIGTIYGGDGRTYFALPDFRGRMPMHAGTGPRLTPRRIGQYGGAEITRLTVDQLPSHTHVATINGGTGNAHVQVNAYQGSGDESSPNENYWAGPTSGGSNFASTTNTSMAADAVQVHVDIMEGNVRVGNTGLGNSVDIVSPFAVVNYIICLKGIFPTRS